jgi:hypothetical protein
VGIFKVQRGPGGGRRINQVATHEEIANRDEEQGLSEAVEDAILAELDLHRTIEAEPGEKKRQVPLEEPTAALSVLLEKINKQSIAWAKKYIDKLDTVDEVERVRDKESTHPKYPGGRVGIIDALNARKEALIAGVEEGDSDEEAETVDRNAPPFDCPECNFRAGSREGLDAHIETTHQL